MYIFNQSYLRLKTNLILCDIFICRMFFNLLITIYLLMRAKIKLFYNHNNVQLTIIGWCM